MKTIEVTILPDGTTKIEAIGFQGKGCADATKSLELVLAGGGDDNKDTTKKRDFFQSSTGRGTTCQ